MSDTVLMPAILLALATAGALEALRCLAEHLLVSALIYSAIAAGLAVAAGKLALDAI